MNNNLAMLKEEQTAGIRDKILVMPSVICSHEVAEDIAAAVDGCVATPHDHGCAQLGRDNERTKRTLIEMGSHPNITGVVVVGLGCEHVQSTTVADELAERNIPVRELSIQGVGGTDACIKRGVELAEDLRTNVAQTADVTELKDLTVGIVGTDLADPTVEVADPLVGDLIDRIRAADGRVIIAGTERLAAYPEIARERIDPSIDDLLAEIQNGPPCAPRVAGQAAARTPEEVTRIWGSGPIDDIVEYGNTPSPSSDCALVSSSSRFEEAATALVAAGAQMIIHVTSDGIPTGHPIAPVIKVSATPTTLKAMEADIDIDARTIDSEDLADYLLGIAQGNLSAAERHGVTSFAIERFGPSM